MFSALNIILSSHAGGAGQGVLVGRSRFFFPSTAPTPLGGGLEAWRGFYASVRPTYKQLMVNVNVCTTAFYTPGNLARAMIEFRDASFDARPNAFVKGVRIRTMHLGYRKTVRKLSSVSARAHRFDTTEYGNVSVEEYFRKSTHHSNAVRH